MLYLLSSSSCTCFLPVVANLSYILSKNNIHHLVINSVKHDGPDDVYLVIWNSVYKLPDECIIYNLDPIIICLLTIHTYLHLRNMYFPH